MPDGAASHAGRLARCTYCRTILAASAPGRVTRMMTRDHILPRARGRVFGGVRNTRLACHRCNQLRAACGHCPAALGLALHFAPRFHGDPVAAARWLRVLGHA